MTIKLNGSTAGSVALDAPASTTGNADINFKLPVADGRAGEFIKTDGSGNLAFDSATPADGSITKAKLGTGSSLPLNFGVISMVDSWGLSGSTNYNSNNHITNDWTRVTGVHGGNVGSVSMSESSGVFTFPETGLY